MKNHKIIKYGTLGVGGQKGIVYSTSGVCCCLPASQYKDATKILVRINNENKYNQTNRQYNSESES